MAKKPHFWLVILFALLQLMALRANAQPNPNFNVSAISGCSPLSETFTNTTTSGTPPYTYIWELGNGNISTLKDASAIYHIPGTYNITLIVTDSKGKTDSITKSITVFKNPTAKFSSDVKVGCPPLLVNFSDLSINGSGSITSWLWDFGDGSGSTSQNPGSHVYTSPGTYQVSLGVTDANGCPDHIYIPAYIYVDKPPAITISASAQFGCILPFTVNFSSLLSPSSTKDTYDWDFGDGTHGTGANPTKAYTSAGTFNVTLTVTDSLGCTSTKTISKYIYVGKPVASFAVSTRGGCAPLPVTFTNTTQGAPKGSKYNWDFGDGTNSTGTSPSHTYGNGSFTVTLIVTTPDGCSDTLKMQYVIKVSKPYLAKYIGDSILCNPPYIATFTNNSGSDTRVLSWDLGDGHILPGGESVTHTYPWLIPDLSQYYKIKLVVTDTDGCVESSISKIHTGPSVARFSPAIFRGCVPDTVTYKNLSTSIDSITVSLWDFGDGTTSNAFTPPPHIYTVPGMYKVTLKITTLNGCKSTFTGAVQVGVPPRANFTSFPDSGCLNKLRHVHFFNLSNVGSSVLADSFHWNFGGGPIIDTLSDKELNVTFNAIPGKYNVTLIAYNNEGCPDTLTKKNLITIDPPWAEYIPFRDTCSLQNRAIFMDRSIGATHVEYYFDDGDSSDNRNPTHFYTKPGCYYPYQVVYDSSNHCSDTFNFYSPPFCLFVKPPWNDSIWPLSDTIGCSPFNVTFKFFDNDTAVNSIFFGDGDTLRLSSPFLIAPNLYSDTVIFSHTYQQPGVYHVSVLAVAPSGCRRYIKMVRKIVVSGLRTVFSVSPVKGCVPLTVTLFDSFPNNLGVLTNYYDMGNGDIMKNTSQKMTYTYTKPPSNQEKGFTISMIKSNISCSDMATDTVYPMQPSTRVYEFNLSSCDSVAYEFVPVTTGIKPYKYFWTSGNGDTSNVVQPTYTFKAGSYNVSMKVLDSAGCADTASFPIVVPSTKDTADFKVSLSNNDCPPVIVNFINKSKFSGPGTHQFYWDFGDGSNSSLENPTKVYYTAGTFTVTLKITDIFGCTSTISYPNVVKIKGPTGEYVFDPKKGCAPLTVYFKASSSNATKFEWDFGDGSPFGHTDTATHVYYNPGTYTPSLVLGDNTCSYGLPPIDDIIVSPAPKADFGYDSICSGQPITLKDMSTSKLNIVKWTWDLGDGSGLDYRQNPTHIYKKAGFYSVKLTVTNSAICSNTIIKPVKYGDIIAGLKAPKSGCIGSPVQFRDQTLSDSAVKSYYWDFGDGNISAQRNPVHVYNRKGIYPVSLYVENYKGCYDSLKNGAYIIIGDTVAPKPSLIYRCTVVDDNTVEIDFGKNTDFDFEKYVVYVRDETGNVKLLDEVLFANDTVYMERGLNNLHHSYCFMVQVVNVCEYKSDTNSSLYHCTINLCAKPGVNEALLSWTPYIGWDVRQYKIYRQSSETPPQFNILDSVPGSQLKYADTTVICYLKMVYRVEGFEKNGNRQVSWSDTAATIPVHVAHVPPTAIVRATVEHNKTTLVEWNTVPNARIKNWMLEKSTDGVNFMAMDTPVLPNVLSESDEKVDVQNNSYTYRLRILDSCGDIGPYGNIGKTILLNIDTNADVKPELVWTAYRDWPEGVQYYDIDIENPGKNFDWLARTASGTDTTFVDNITDLNSLPFYTYHVVAHRNGTLASPDKNLNITSMSNDATLRPRSRLFIPNAFTPNGDGINDSFFVKGLYIKDFHIKIFDRWGTKVFESSSMKDKWGGRYKNGPPVMDAYKYLIYYRGVEDIDRYAVGWVTLLE